MIHCGFSFQVHEICMYEKRDFLLLERRINVNLVAERLLLFI